MRAARVAGAPIRSLATRSVMEAFLARGRLATISSRGAVTIWDLATGKAVGKLAGLGTPASNRVDRAGTKLALSAFDRRYAVFDADAAALIAEGASIVSFAGDATFDGNHYVGTNTFLDMRTGAAKSHEKGWLAGRTRPWDCSQRSRLPTTIRATRSRSGKAAATACAGRFRIRGRIWRSAASRAPYDRHRRAPRRRRGPLRCSRRRRAWTQSSSVR